jgi:outer membrane biosynthesis protein TonB
MDAGSVVERQKNVLQIEALATEAITTAVRGLLPVKQILRDYLDAGDQEELEDDAVAAPAPAVPSAFGSEDVEPETERPALEVEELLPPKPVAPVPEPESGIQKEEEKPEPVVVQKEEVASPPPPAAAPAIVKIDTEPTSVHFSDYDDVHSEHGEPEILFAPKGGLGEDDEDDDAGLEINEASARTLTDDLDLEDFDKPAGTAAAPAPVEEELEVDELLD